MLAVLIPTTAVIPAKAGIHAVLHRGFPLSRE
jgi:hypothetical protein